MRYGKKFDSLQAPDTANAVGAWPEALLADARALPGKLNKKIKKG